MYYWFSMIVRLLELRGHLRYTDGTRLVVTVQMLLDIALIAGFARLVIIATRTGIRRKGTEH